MIPSILRNVIKLDSNSVVVALHESFRSLVPQMVQHSIFSWAISIFSEIVEKAHKTLSAVSFRFEEVIAYKSTKKPFKFVHVFVHLIKN